MKQNIFKLCKKKHLWFAHFDAPTAFRTSAHLDRIMKYMERYAINSQMFHARVQPISKTSKNFRAFALISNFAPFNPVTAKKLDQLNSPVAQLKGFVYSKNWLENLNIAASLNGFRY